MKPFEFVVIFIFIIFGMAISEVIVSVANILRYYDKVVFYLPPFLWAVSGWLFALNYFFSLYKLERIKVWNVRNFGILIFSTTLFVTDTYLVWPGNFNGESLDLKMYFRHNSFSIYFATMALMFSLGLEAWLIYESRKIMVYISHGSCIFALSIGCIFNNEVTDYLISVCMVLIQVFVTWRSPNIIMEK